MTSQDPYYVYRPLLDLLGLSEGTDPPKGRGYNETLSYGAFTGGPVDLVTMSLDQVDQLQSRMLAHPRNSWNSSAAGRYQIVRTTRRTIQQSLGIPGSALFNAAMQDRMGCYLLGVRGIDKWLSGRLKLRTLVNNLAKEWASLPVFDTGLSHYSNQGASVTVGQVKEALGEVRLRHMKSAPARPVVPVPLDKPAVKTVGFWERIGNMLFGGSIMGGAAFFQDWRMLAVFGGAIILLAIFGLIFHQRIINAVKAIKQAVA